MEPTSTPEIPTATPEPTVTMTPEPTATPECPETGFFCELNQEMYRGGDTFILSADACNNGDSDLEVDAFMLLEVYGYYWFWPSWSVDMDYSTITIPPCDCLEMTILEFTWPQDAGSADGLRFYCAMFEPGTWEMVGAMSMCSFGYE